MSLVWRARSTNLITPRPRTRLPRRSWAKGSAHSKETMLCRIDLCDRLNSLNPRRTRPRGSYRRRDRHCTMKWTFSIKASSMTPGLRVCKRESETIHIWQRKLRRRRWRLVRKQVLSKSTSQLQTRELRTLKTKEIWVTLKSMKFWLKSAFETKRTSSLNTRSKVEELLKLQWKLNRWKLSERWRWNFNTIWKLRETMLRSWWNNLSRRRRRAKKCLTLRSQQSRI